MGHPREVGHPVEAPELLQGLRKDRLHRFRVGYVGHHGDGLGLEGRHRLGQEPLLPVHGHEARPLPGEEVQGRPPDAAGRTRDEDGFPRKPSHQRRLA